MTVLFSGEVTNAELVALVAAAAVEASKAVAGGLPREDAPRMCWEYVRHGTRYLEETDPNGQLPRMPWRFAADGVGDCKSQAIYIAAVCAASGCSVVLRFATLPGDTLPGHVYAVVDNSPVDPLLSYGAECSYIAALDVPVPTRIR